MRLDNTLFIGLILAFILMTSWWLSSGALTWIVGYGLLALVIGCFITAARMGFDGPDEGWGYIPVVFGIVILSIFGIFLWLPWIFGLEIASLAGRIGYLVLSIVGAVGSIILFEKIARHISS